MKYFFIYVISIFFNIYTSVDTDKAIIKAYKKENYKQVCNLSKDRDISSFSTNLKLILADSYYYTNKTDIALSTYSLVLETKEIFYFNTFQIERYFKLLMLCKQYEKIKSIYKSLSIKNKESKYISNIYESALFVSELKNFSNEKFQLLDYKQISSINMEYGMHFFENNILCYSSPVKNIYNGLLRDRNNGFLNEYSEISEKRYTLKSVLLDYDFENSDQYSEEEMKKLNFSTSKSFVSYVNFNCSDTTYFTDFSKNKHTQIISLVKQSNGKYKHFKCSFCKDNFDYAMPCLSQDGNTIYFVSNDSSGFGGWDIFKSEKKKNGKWGPSINLGNEINTPFDEIYPFVSEDSKMYFSSNGHKGFGGFDVYSYVKVNDKVEITNLLQPINTEANDISFIISPSKKRAFCFRQSNNNDDINEMIRSFVCVSDTLIKKPKNIQISNLNVPTKAFIPKVSNTKVKIIRDKVPNSHTRESLTSTVKTLDLPIREEIISTAKVPDLPIGERLTNSAKVSFLFDKYDIMLNQMELIDSFFSSIKNIEDYDILLSGYADFIGEENYNLWMSHKRIESVADYLVKSNGISRDKIFCVAYGEYDLNVDISRKRRVVIELVDKNRLNNKVLIIHKLCKESSVKDIENIFLCSGDDLCLINSISKTTVIPKGALILVPIKGLHRVENGNTIYSISKSFGTSVDRVNYINNISSNFKISTKEILIIN